MEAQLSQGQKQVVKNWKTGCGWGVPLPTFSIKAEGPKMLHSLSGGQLPSPYPEMQIV